MESLLPGTFLCHICPQNCSVTEKGYLHVSPEGPGCHGPHKIKPLHDVFEYGDESIKKRDALINVNFGFIAFLDVRPTPMQCDM